MEFTEEALIAEVEKHRVLYDLSHRMYYDTKVKDNAWQEISDCLNTEVETCKKKWKALRECFRKSKLRRKTLSGQEAKHWKPWKYQKEMSFLNLWMDAWDKQPNVSPAHEVGDTDDADSVDIDDIQNDDTQTTTFSTRNPSPLDSPSGSSSFAIKRQKNQVKRTSAKILQRYFDKEESRSIKESSQSTNDHIRQFFASSEAIFRMLPAEEQVDARVEITQLMAKYEKQVLLKRVLPTPSPSLV